MMLLDQVSIAEYNSQKINLLPIMVAQQLVLFPIYFFIPIWVTSLCLSMALLVYLSQVKQKIRLPVWIKHVFTLAAFAGVLFSFHKFSGRDAGVALIATMYGLKIIEIKAKRDVYVLMLLGFFVLLAGFLFEQSPAIAVYQFVPVAAILNALISIHSLPKTNHIVQQSFSSTIKPLLKYMILAIPLMVVLFVFFPRLSGPIWKIPGGSHGTSGISDTMSPGAISSLQLFDKIAFRVRFDANSPKGSDMYWRTLVLDEFDGLTWSREAKRKEHGIVTFAALNSVKTGMLEYQGSANYYSYDISLESTRQRWLTFLDRPIDIPRRAKLFTDYSVQIDHRLLDRTRYRAESLLGLKLDVSLPALQREKNTKLPTSGNSQALNWAKLQRQLYSSDRDFVNSLLLRINRQEYFYTLSPPIMLEDTVDDFWFSQQKGFCEHYAGALVFMARAANIPARVVIGYQGGEKNPLSDYWIVRYANAHAWTEIWFENEGWVRVDPTAAIARHRIEEQLQLDYSQRDSLFDDFGFDAVNLDDIGWIKQFEYWVDKVNNGWNDWILDYNQDSQQRLFKGLGLDKLTKEQIGLLMMSILGIFLSLISWRWLRDRPNLDSIQISLRILDNKLLKYGMNLSASQGANALIIEIEEIQKQQPVFSSKSQTQIIKILKLYTYLRFQRLENSQKQQNHFRQQVKALRIQNV